MTAIGKKHAQERLGWILEGMAYAEYYHTDNTRQIAAERQKKTYHDAALKTIELKNRLFAISNPALLVFFSFPGAKLNEAPGVLESKRL